MEDAAVAVVLHLHRGVRPADGGELHGRAIRTPRLDENLLARAKVIVDGYREDLVAVEPQAVGVLSG